MIRTMALILPVTVIVALASAGTAAAAPSAAAVPAPSPARDYDKPPPGSKADQALWQAAYDLDNDILLERAAASRLQHEAKTHEVLERLEAQSAKGALPADRANELRKRVSEEWARSMDLLVSQWPVDPTRGCRYDLLNFEGVMFSNEGPQKAGQLDDTRKALSACVARGTPAVRALRRANEDLRGAIAAAEVAIAAAAATAAPPALPAAAPAAR